MIVGESEPIYWKLGKNSRLFRWKKASGIRCEGANQAPGRSHTGRTAAINE
jgi:hypothetical protein